MLFYSQVLIDMANASVDGSPAWYPLSAHDDSSSPLGPPTPTQISSGIRDDGGDGKDKLEIRGIYSITCYIS